MSFKYEAMDSLLGNSFICVTEESGNQSTKKGPRFPRHRGIRVPNSKGLVKALKNDRRRVCTGPFR